MLFNAALRPGRGWKTGDHFSVRRPKADRNCCRKMRAVSEKCLPYFGQGRNLHMFTFQNCFVTLVGYENNSLARHVSFSGRYTSSFSAKTTEIINWDDPSSSHPSTCPCGTFCRSVSRAGRSVPYQASIRLAPGQPTIVV